MNLAPESSTPNHAAAALAGPKRATAKAGPAAPKRTSAKAGFAMAALLVAIAVMGIMLSVALPTWSHMIRREKEEELIFRGNQYARAINLYGRRTTSPVVPSIDMLIEQRLLRKKYKDPLSPNKDGEFQLLYAQDQNAPGRGSGSPPGSQPGSPPGSPNPPARGAGARGAGMSGSAFPSTSGSIIGVASKNTGESIRIYKGKQRYNEWQFTGVELSSTPGGGGQGGPPGMPGGTGPRGGPPGGPRGGGSRTGPQGSRMGGPQDPGTTFTPIQILQARAAKTASCTAGRTSWIIVFSLVGLTRLVRNTTYKSRSGSIHNDVPVNPVCPNADADR